MNGNYNTLAICLPCKSPLSTWSLALWRTCCDCYWRMPCIYLVRFFQCMHTYTASGTQAFKRVCFHSAPSHLSLSTMDPTHPLSSGDAWNRLCDVVEYSGIFDSEKRQPHSKCMVDTRVALRGSLRELLDRHDQTNIWLNGLAGVGKTSIAFTIAEEMKRAGRLAATFFFSHKHAQGATEIIPTIAYQLALTFPRIRDDITRAVENDGILLSSDKSRGDQMRELIINPLHTLKFRQETPYAIIIDALDECFSAEEAARLVALLTDTLSGPDLPIIHLIFTSRPEGHIRTAMQASVHEISLTTRDDDTIQDVRLFLRVSLDKIRTSRPAVFGHPPKPWPSHDEFETLAFKTGGLFVYAAMAINFISATGHHPRQRLDLLLREKSTVGADIDQLYRQIIATSENPLAHCRMLASIIQLFRPLSLIQLQGLFHEDQETLAVTLEVFSPVILNPPDNVGTVEIYHASLRDFIRDPTRSKDFHVDDAHAHEHLARCCLDFLTREATDGPEYSYARVVWDHHLALAHHGSDIRKRFALFTKGPFFASAHDLNFRISLLNMREICLSLKWIRNPSDIAAAWRVIKALRRVEKKARRRDENV
ncbi:hypothetical protein K503DRAFT_483129 [Rhizopogon vinicolor AM-OR11-026]|uniref:Nephrocystin 3-like N-terminal domain-containing protein n=1 Tax=Rhizopogon vinicolor AM-OR11-026 TaxID=1314800 RepID=A0A1B7MMT6_9AGAM|nr:hypothetical protein K503DRAFT_483129 [Rhizopogon vinicolor AM-OR11-026]